MREFTPYYDPTIGRFITEDSVWGKDSDPLSLNLYTYCRNDPVNLIDPSGHRFYIIGDEYGPERDENGNLNICIISKEKLESLQNIPEISPIVTGASTVAKSTPKVVKGIKSIASKAGKFIGNLFKEKPKSKPYSKSRPSYGKGQVDEVWENAKDIDGKVYDPNTGEELTWDKSKSRAGQWDMGHTPENKYSDILEKYMNNTITKDEFLEWYKNPNNYRPESPSANRSHNYEN